MRRTSIRRKNAGKVRLTRMTTIMEAVEVVQFRDRGRDLEAGGEARAAAVRRVTAAGADIATTVISWPRGLVLGRPQGGVICWSLLTTVTTYFSRFGSQFVLIAVTSQSARV